MPRASRAFAACAVYVALVSACLLVIGEGALIARSARRRDAIGIIYKVIGVGHLCGSATLANSKNYCIGRKRRSAEDIAENVSFGK